MSTTIANRASTEWPYAGEDSPQMIASKKEISNLAHLLKLAEDRLEQLPLPAETPNDPAYVNLRGHRKNLDRDISRGFTHGLADAEVKTLRKRLEYAQKTAPVPFTREELAAALVIRTDAGWHTLVRVNDRTVTVKTGMTFTDRYKLDTVLEVRA